jgi:hypothetical protein
VCCQQKIVNAGEQLTICFHVDDCKISHKDPKVTDEFINWLHDNYESRLFDGGSGKMAVHRGKVHKYLGMTLNYSQKGEVELTMLDYTIDEILAAFNAEDPAAAREKPKPTSAAPDDLHKIDADCQKLPNNFITS